MKPKFMDLGGPEGLSEDQRITMIGNRAMLGEKVGVLLDYTSLSITGEEIEDPAKIDRYIAKVIARFPSIECTFRAPYFKDGSVIALTFERKRN